MMTAMARLPCKSSTATNPQQQQQQQQQQPFRHNNSYGNTNRSYWDMQRQQIPSTHTRNQHRQIIDHTGKRRSAVELLQESKAFYVKSETVLDRKQELKNCGHLQVAPSTTPVAPPRLLRKSSIPCPPPQSFPMSPTSNCCRPPDRTDGILSPPRPPALPPKSPRLITLPQRRSTLQGSLTVGDQLQTKLRRLLNTDSKENINYPDSPVSPNNHHLITLSPKSPSPLNNPSHQLSPAGQSSLEVRFKFGRSNSHSHTPIKKMDQKSNGSQPICQPSICHKSLPDLHTPARRRSSLSPRASKPSNCPDCETSSDYSDQSFKRDSVCYRSSRHIRRSLGSGGNDASSVLSSGGRTQKSSGSSKLSHGAARDSGGSSGHCTHRSEPPPRLQDCWGYVRRDSGASTQHSGQHSEKDRSRKGSNYLRNISPDSESSHDYSPTCGSRFSDGWKEGRGRPILRSKSDISDHYWRHDSNGRSYERKKPVPPPRPPRTVTELENFFDRLGLDSDRYERITVPGSNSSSPVFFDSVSSVDSALGLYPWGGGKGSGHEGGWNGCAGGNDTSQRVSDPPSIVERNARIIKWLCQCRKVQFGYS